MPDASVPPSPAPDGRGPLDPVLARRRRIAGLVVVGKRIGYGLFAVAIVAFVIGFVIGYGDGITTTITWAIVVGSLVLAPAIVFGYAVGAAEREDRAQGRSTLEP